MDQILYFLKSVDHLISPPNPPRHFFVLSTTWSILDGGVILNMLDSWLPKTDENFFNINRNKKNKLKIAIKILFIFVQMMVKK